MSRILCFCAIFLLFNACEKRSDKAAVKEEGAPSSYSHLKGLEWLIGKWVDKDENLRGGFRGKLGQK